MERRPFTEPPRAQTIRNATVAKAVPARHQPIRDWEERVDQLLGDEPAHPNYPSWELEKSVGHRVLSGEIDAVQGYEELGNL